MAHIAPRVLDPADAVLRPCEILEQTVGQARGARELVVERRRRAPPIEHGIRRPLRAGDVRRRVRRHVFGVDRDRDAAALEQTRRGEPDRAAAHDRGAIARTAPAVELGDRERRRAPRERHPAAAVAVVVHEQLVAQPLGAQHEPRLS